MTSSIIKYGWGTTDITPPQPVLLAGSHSVRISEGVNDPLSATVWAVESADEQVVFVSCDLLCISNELRDAVRAKVAKLNIGIDPLKIVMNGTHTHLAPETRPYSLFHIGGIGIQAHEVPEHVMFIDQYIEFVSDRLSHVIGQAWNDRVPGGIGYGLGYVVIGRNRRWVNAQNRATMHGLNEATAESFRYIEGYEDHSLNVIATYDANRILTGLVINFACPAQVPPSKSGYEISSDVWRDIRRELHETLGDHVFILPQCGFAGEQTGHPQFDKRAEERMQRLEGRNKREEVANMLSHEIQRILPVIESEIVSELPLKHIVDQLDIRANSLTEDDVQFAEQQVSELQTKLDQEEKKLNADPEYRRHPRWYNLISTYRCKIAYYRNVIRRFEYLQHNATFPAEVHVLRLGDLAFASVPYEYYLDYGVQIKVQSPAIQNFLIQLAGSGTYVPSERSVAFGGYGSTPAENPIGPAGGQQLAEHIAKTMHLLWG